MLISESKRYYNQGDEVKKHNKDIIKISDECNDLVEYAKMYIKENRKLTSNIDQEVRDAVLIDSINYFGLINGYDCLFNTDNLYDSKKYSVKIDINNLLNSITKVYSNYIFEEGIVDSVLLNGHTNKLEFNEQDGILVLIDFINYISKINNIDKIFTLKELKEKHQQEKHIKEMNELKKFLTMAYEYYDRLYEDDTIEEIYEEMCTKYELKNISSTGTYNYTLEASKKYGRTQMYPWDKRLAEKELYAMSYAYAKMYGGNKHSLKIKPIKQKINEMKHR